MQMKEKTQYSNKKLKKEIKFCLLILVVIVCLLLIIIYICNIGENSKKVDNSFVHDSTENMTKPIDTSDEEEIEDIIGDDEKEDIVDESAPVNKPVSESEKCELSYFDDAVFIGDSRVEGFILNTGLHNTTSYTHKGLSVNRVLSDPIINLNGELVSIIDALKRTDFSKVYLMMGINELGWVYSNVFIKKYEEVINAIQDINPDAIIYVQSILPVSEKVSQEHSYIKNDKIVKYNKLLLEMSAKKKVYYVNVFESMINESGALPEEAAFDGIHLKKKYCKVWLEYLLTHTANKGEIEY